MRVPRVDRFFVPSGLVMTLSHGRDFRARFRVGTLAQVMARRRARAGPRDVVTRLSCLILYWMDRESQDLRPEPSWLAVGPNTRAPRCDDWMRSRNGLV